MTTHEHVTSDSSEGRPEIALGYALMAVCGMVMGFLLAWIF